MSKLTTVLRNLSTFWPNACELEHHYLQIVLCHHFLCSSKDTEVPPNARHSRLLKYVRILLIIDNSEASCKLLLTINIRINISQFSIVRKLVEVNLGKAWHHLGILYNIHRVPAVTNKLQICGNIYLMNNWSVR